MKREETVKVLAPEFLKGKSEAAVNKFMSKSIDKQYASLMAWKRRNSIEIGSTVTVADILKSLSRSRGNVVKLESLSDREAKKLLAELDNFKNTVDNFSKIQKERRLADMERERARIERDIEALRSEIAE